MIKWNDENGWFSTTNLEYFMYDNDLKKIQLKNMQKGLNWQNILYFF
jgi:hypothetical protein